MSLHVICHADTPDLEHLQLLVFRHCINDSNNHLQLHQAELDTRLWYFNDTKSTTEAARINFVKTSTPIINELSFKLSVVLEDEPETVQRTEVRWRFTVHHALLHSAATSAESQGCARFGEFWLFCTEQVETLPL